MSEREAKRLVRIGLRGLIPETSFARMVQPVTPASGPPAHRFIVALTNMHFCEKLQQAAAQRAMESCSHVLAAILDF